MPKPKMQVRQYTQWKITQLDRQRGESQGRAAMARLRRGVGHVPGDMPLLWGTFLAGMPEELRSPSGVPSRAEWAVYTALTLWALHQQGRPDSVQAAEVSLGSAAHRLAGGNQEEQERVWNRLNLVAQADDMQALSYRLRQLVTLLRAGGVGLDYALLAADLYEYQHASTANQVRLRWGQDFFHFSKSDEEAKENE